jgi:hypothetical protein
MQRRGASCTRGRRFLSLSVSLLVARFFLRARLDSRVLGFLAHFCPFFRESVASELYGVCIQNGPIFGNGRAHTTVHQKNKYLSRYWRTSRESLRPDRTIKQLDRSPFHHWCIDKLNRQGGPYPPVYRNVPTGRDRRQDQKLRRVFSAGGWMTLLLGLVRVMGSSPLILLSDASVHHHKPSRPPYKTFRHTNTTSPPSSHDPLLYR